jgi:hypothetical protein
MSDEADFSGHHLVFISGLHRSGTSLLFKCLREHPALSGFHDTGVPEDEGQHLQTVFRPAKDFGGPGNFGFHRGAFLDENSPLATPGSARQLYAEWSRHWELGKPYLMEKSPPTLIRTRFFQALFPDSYFIVLLRHPVAVAYATQKWSKTSLGSLLRHWLVCHEAFERDRPALRRVLCLSYEDFAQRPDEVLVAICKFLGVAPFSHQQKILSDVNDKYFSMWRQEKDRFWGGLRTSRAIRFYEERVRRFGYSLRDLSHVGESCLPLVASRSQGFANVQLQGSDY